MKLSRLFNDFFHSEKAGGLLLLIVTTISLVLANSPVKEAYTHLWHIEMAGEHLSHWINDGLMTIFFLLIGLELEREVYLGELSNIKTASLPLFGALGGMLIPAGLYLVFNFGTPTQAGAGIPMATDIAFAIGILSLLGNKVPASLKVFLTALAVMDDLGAIIVIAVFYTKSLAFTNLFIALAIWGVLLILNRLHVRNMIPYLIGGIFMWYFMLHSGVHATITGVLLAFALPFGNGDEHSTSYKLQHFLHRPVAFIILPLFAMANTCLTLSDGWQYGISQNNSIGIVLGLFIGKPLGICCFALLGTLMGACALPTDLNWKHILGAGMLGGIGFTMSIFITLLAFNEPTHIDEAKIAILCASICSGLAGFLMLRKQLKVPV